MLNAFARKPTSVHVTKPADSREPATIERRTRPTRPAPDMLTINRKALDIATGNLLARANRDTQPWNRESALPGDVKTIAAWLAEAPNRDDYDTRVETLNAHVLMGGESETRSSYDTSIITTTSGEALIRKARGLYKQLIGDN
ncbi:hypothetical protein [Nonomuraea candida]|uniref:hypothetical protein n=1 Tax=Nonomuraea candida TaxID=359159 RepID=UPI0005BA463E|nr:hypothetical protein [Nonomuraea candida]